MEKYVYHTYTYFSRNLDFLLQKNEMLLVMSQLICTLGSKAKFIKKKKQTWKVCLEGKKYFEDVSVIKKLIPKCGSEIYLKFRIRIQTLLYTFYKLAKVLLLHRKKKGMILFHYKKKEFVIFLCFHFHI